MFRDMTRREFHAAIKRHGWRQELMWILGTGKDGRTTGVGMVMRNRGNRGKGWEINRRASLAKAIRELQSATA